VRRAGRVIRSKISPPFPPFLSWRLPTTAAEDEETRRAERSRAVALFRYAVNNLAIQALIAAYAARKAIVDESAARTAATEVTSD
jgi:hypothetical protein